MCLAHDKQCDLESHLCYQVSKHISYQRWTHFFISHVQPGYMSKIESRALPHWKKQPRLLWPKAQELHGLSDFRQRNSPYAPESFKAQLSQQAKFPGACGTYVHSRADLVYMLILRRSQSSPFSLLCSTLWKPTGLPHAPQTVCFLHSLCTFCHRFCPEEHYQLGGCLKIGTGFVLSSFHLLSQVILCAQRGICGWTGLAQTIFIHGAFDVWMASENSKSRVQSSFHGWKIHFRSPVEANTITKLSEPS